MESVKEKMLKKQAYTEKKDEEIVVAIRNGDLFALEFLMDKYKDFVRAKTRPYFLIGADRDDILQEGMIGLYKAVRDYNPDKAASFRSFADICVTRQIITAVKASNRQKHMPLNSYVSLNRPMYEEDNERSTFLDLMATTKIVNPEDIFIVQENVQDIEEMISKKLSKLEKEVLSLYLQGKSYQDIAHEMDKPHKSIDNALQRVKHKLEELIQKKMDK